MLTVPTLSFPTRRSSDRPCLLQQPHDLFIAGLVEVAVMRADGEKGCGLGQADKLVAFLSKLCQHVRRANRHRQYQPCRTKLAQAFERGPDGDRKSVV